VTYFALIKQLWQKFAKCKSLESCKTPQMCAEYLGRIGQDVLPKREGLIEWKCYRPNKKTQDDHNFEVC
jgi:hypothetical protein